MKILKNVTCDGVSVHVVDQVDVGQDADGDPLRSGDVVGSFTSGCVDPRILATALNENWHIGALHVGLQFFVASVVSRPNQGLTGGVVGQGRDTTTSLDRV